MSSSSRRPRTSAHQGPGLTPAWFVEPEGRNTAAAIALATLAIDRPDADVMVVLPADHHIADEPTFRQILPTVATRLAAGGACGVESPSSRSASSRRSRRRSTATSSRPSSQERSSRVSRSTCCRHSGRSRRPTTRPGCSSRRGRLERGHVPVAPRRDPGRARDLGAGRRRRGGRAAHGRRRGRRLRTIAATLDRLRGDGARGRGRHRPHGVDGRRVDRRRHVVGACSRCSAPRGSRRASSAGTATATRAGDLVIDRDRIGPSRARARRTIR
jgi:hypothetical protein